jgi:hypothetical protein
MCYTECLCVPLPPRGGARTAPKRKMLTGIHFLLTYACNLECEHCFLYCGPHSQGTFTLAQVEDALDQAGELGTVEGVYFEGGEPFLYYPLLVEGVSLARARGFQPGIVTNCYWATSEPDAELWLRPLAALGLADLSVSDDAFHYGAVEDSPAQRALRVARRMGIPSEVICIDAPTVETEGGKGQERGRPIIGGGAMFRGRAAERLVRGLPTRPWEELAECAYENLRDPGRVHVDSFGHVHLCQGLCMGNTWQTALSDLAQRYRPEDHPICGPLLRGGPAQLARELDVDHQEEYVDECHLCYSLRLALIDRFPQYLAPRQVYGLD